MLGVFGILLSLGLLMYLAYRGISVLILAPILACLAAVLNGQPILGTYTQIFMENLGGYLIKYFPIFMLGAIFGKVMGVSGAADSIANWIIEKIGAEQTILSIVLATALLTYGGVSLFVVVFAVYPLGAAAFRRAGVPKRFLPATIALGAFTFTMTAIPGTPQVQNAIPMPYFQTTPFAAPVLGVIAAICMCGGGLFWLKIRAGRAMAAGEGYGDHDEDLEHFDASEVPQAGKAVIPIIVVLVSNFLLSKKILPNIDASYLDKPKFGATDLGSVLGIWSLILAVLLGIIAAIVLMWDNFDDLKETINEGVMGSLLPIFNTASEVGYGNVIASLTAFVVIKEFMLGISPGNPLISEALSVNVLAGITGSASGGMSIALEALSSKYMEIAQQTGLSPQVLHRVASLAAGGFDTLPHNGAVITLLTITGLDHEQSYGDMAMCTLVIPFATLVLVIILGSMGVV
ncbi:GntP family permease [Halanaerobaculum tunisiense]